MPSKTIERKTLNRKTYELVLEPDGKTFAIYEIRGDLGDFVVWPKIRSFTDKNEALEYVKKMDS